MCGVAGLMSMDKIDTKDVLAMTYCLAHRGPDAQNILLNSDATVALGHTRLSVIDLSSRSNQPMSSVDGRYSIVFNGEIYNYKIIRERLLVLNNQLKFLTHSDTEVILQGYIQWGSNVCGMLEGMFAFVIFDAHRQELFICRDRVGKKPLYYFHSRSLFAFASEVKSLLKHPIIQKRKEVNYDAIYTFLHTGYIPEPQTGYTSISKFPAGHFAYLKGDLSLKIVSYKRIPSDVTDVGVGKRKNPILAIKSALTEAIGKRMVSDVPLGAFLSGGTDSSLIVALAAQQRPESVLKTFSVGFTDSQFDETHYARRVAQILKTEHHEYMLDEKEAVEILEEHLTHFDEPFADTSFIPMMQVCRLAKKDITVALTGDGGDELFLGYGAYDWAKRLDQFWATLFQSPAAYTLRKLGTSRLKRIGLLLEKVERDEVRSHIFSQEQYFFSRSEIKSMAINPSPAFTSLRYKDPMHLHLNASEKQALYDVQFYLKDDLLVKVDRASMLYGLECRCPFLDPKVIDLALSLPYRLKNKDGERKWILKEILKEYLPESLVYRRKWGFSIPLLRWMRNDLSYLGDRFLSESMVNDIGIVDGRYVRKLRSSFANGDDFLYNRIWVLIVAHKWLYENGA